MNEELLSLPSHFVEHLTVTEIDMWHQRGGGGMTSLPLLFSKIRWNYML